MYYVMHNDPLEQWHETRQEQMAGSSVQMLHSEKGENGFVDETVYILIQSLLWLRYHTVYSETLELTMKWTPAKLCNKDRLMPNWMLVNCILPSVIFSSIKTAP